MLLFWSWLACVSAPTADCDPDHPGRQSGHVTLVDGDGDGFSARGPRACDAPEPDPDTRWDCNDADPAVHPDAPYELCNGVDDDCDGVPEGQDLDHVFWIDHDGDGFGSAPYPHKLCEIPEGYPFLVDRSGDCDEQDPGIHPGAAEVCDSVDQDCDGDPENGYEGLAHTWYTDDDADGFGVEWFVSCEPEAGAALAGGDCDDADPGAFPGASEACDGVDQDCDGAVDEAARASWYGDADGDGWGAGRPFRGDGCSAPSGWSVRDGDCADGDALRHPEADDICGDGLDQDCTGRDCVTGLVEDFVHIAASPDGPHEVGELVVLGDVDGDGADDLAGGFNPDVWLFTDVSRPQSWSDAAASVYLPTLWLRAAAAGDATGDGLADLWVADPDVAGCPGAWLLPGTVRGPADEPDSVGRLLQPCDGAGVAPVLASPGDLDGDGFAEVLVGGAEATLISGPFPGDVWLPDVADRIVTDPATELTPRRVGDVTGDGRADVVLVDDGRGDVFLFDAPPVGGQPASDALAVLRGDYGWPGDVIAADTDGDGHLDLLRSQDADSGAPVAEAWRGPFVGLRGVGSRDAVLEGAFGLAALGDIDGDGSEDVATCDRYGAYVFLGPLGGATSAAHADVRLLVGHDHPQRYTDVAALDTDGDGDLELAIALQFVGDYTLGMVSLLDPAELW
jgi:hypothetical protein